MAAKQEVTKPNTSALPAHLQGGKTARIGNVDSSDLIIPRVKLMQAISPEVTAFNNCQPGQFWHTIANELIGDKLRGVPLLMQKSYTLWAPRNDDRGILARAGEDGVWDNAGMEFIIKPKGSPHEIKYKLGKTVFEKTGDGPAMSEFGSSIPGDKNSPPAASLTYRFLWYFLDFPEMSPAIILNARSSIRPGKDLLSKIEMKPVDHFAQVYEIGIVQEQGDEGPFYNYTYRSDGYVEDEAIYEKTKGLYERFRDTTFRTNDESEDSDKGVGGSSHRTPGPSDSSKF